MSKRKMGRPMIYTDEERAERMREAQKAYHEKSGKYVEYQRMYRLKKFKEKLIDSYDLDKDTIQAIWEADSRYAIRDIIKL